MPRLRSPAVGTMLVACAASMWGFWPYFLRNAESYGAVDPALESTFAMGMCIVLGVLVVRSDRVPVRANARAWIGIAWLGVSDALNALFFFKAYQATSVAVAVLTHYLAPLFVAIAAPFFVHERADRRTSVAVLLSSGGLVFLLEPWRTHASSSTAVGAMFGAASAFFYASNVLVNKRLQPVFSGSEMMLFHALLATPLLAALVPRDAWHSLDARAVHWLLAGSVFSGAIPGLLFVWGLRAIPASRASTLTLLEPLVAVTVVGVVIFGEAISALGALGGAFILAGAALVLSRAEKKWIAE
ncbi:MAG: DMT family transporter [Polyangiaceae bacterium]